MGEVTRLTRAGRLTDAVALLQGRSPTEGLANPGAEEAGQRFLPAAVPSDASATTPQRSGAGRAADRPSVPDTALPRIARAIGSVLGRLGSAGLPGGKDLPGAEPPASTADIPAGARFEDRVFADAAGTRSYKLYVPSRYAGAPIPLVVMLHGCKQSPDDFAAGTGMNALAEAQTVMVAYPAQAQSANPQRCWNWFNAADQRRDAGEPSLLAGITRQIAQEFQVDRDRIYVAGLSAGGAAAAVMASVYPDLYSAVGIHSGLACGAAKDVSSAFAAMGGHGTVRARGSRRAVPTIVFHGDADRTVHPVNADQVAAQARPDGAGAPAVTQGQSAGGVRYTRTVQADADGRPVLEQWLLHGAGHAWAGGNPRGSYTDPRGPDASREMLRFFLEHARPAG